MIGNDIIDILETKQTSNWERAGFLEKIFTCNEQAIINKSSDPFTSVWQLWSMKESAYKVFIQAGGKRFFNPSKIECTLKNSEIGEVKIGEICLKTNSTFHSEYIFSTASLENEAFKTAIFKLPENNYKLQSDFVHQELLNDFSKKKHLDLEYLKIQKSEAGVPFLYFKNAVVNVSISLSHHGQYGAFSWIEY